MIKNCCRDIAAIRQEKVTFTPAHSLPDRIHKGQPYHLDIILPGTSRDDCLAFRENLQKGIYNFSLEKCTDPVRRTLALLEEEQPPINGHETCLDFVTPLNFTPHNKKRQWLIDKDAFFNRLTARITHFFDFSLPGASRYWHEIRLLPYFWQPGFDRSHKSSSNKGSIRLRGATGPLFLRGPLAGIWPLLLLGSEFGCGAKSAFGAGHFRISRNHSVIDKRLQEINTLRQTVGDIEENSDMADKLAQTFLDRTEALRELHQQILSKEFAPESATGFYVDKPRDGKRFLSTLPVRDYLVHKLLYRVLRVEMDRMFEEASIGFRPKRSRDDARKMIREAAAEGFHYVLEADIASFFDEIDWDILIAKINSALPEADQLARKLLLAVIRQPVEVHGKALPRTKGLLQGSPLSPLLANLYLDSFDEEMEARGFRLIRYGDDFLVMTRNDREADQALQAIREILAELKLTLKEEKTGFSSINRGFSFLGLTFDAELGENFVAAPDLGKTLFVREQYAFVGIDGESVVIRKKQTLLARLPVKRIREIVLFGSVSLSSRLIQKCAFEKIPLSFCARGGYYYSTLRPDSRRHFSRAAVHGSRHGALANEEIRQVARLIVNAKLHNYLSWFKERWPVETRKIRREFELLLADISKATTLEKIRGYEGAAAKLSFPVINALCKDPAFHCRRRRKRKREDRFNSMLDFAYSLLFNRLNVLLRNQGLNPYLGFLHSHRDHFESLVCDLQEPFRCRIDRFVVKIINRKIIQAHDFIVTDSGQLHLTGSAVGRFLEAFEREMSVRLGGDSGTLKQLLIAQVRSLRQWVDHNDGLKFYYLRNYSRGKH